VHLKDRRKQDWEEANANELKIDNRALNGLGLKPITPEMAFFRRSASRPEICIALRFDEKSCLTPVG